LIVYSCDKLDDTELDDSNLTKHISCPNTKMKVYWCNNR